MNLYLKLIILRGASRRSPKALYIPVSEVSEKCTKVHNCKNHRRKSSKIGQDVQEWVTTTLNDPISCYSFDVSQRPTGPSRPTCLGQVARSMTHDWKPGDRFVRLTGPRCSSHRLVLRTTRELGWEQQVRPVRLRTYRVRTWWVRKNATSFFQVVNMQGEMCGQILTY